MNWLPTYFDKVLGANLAELGPVKTLPYLIMFAMSNVGNLCGDRLIARGGWSVAAARKGVNTVGAGLVTVHICVQDWRCHLQHGRASSILLTV